MWLLPQLSSEVGSHAIVCDFMVSLARLPGQGFRLHSAIIQGHMLGSMTGKYRTLDPRLLMAIFQAPRYAGAEAMLKCGARLLA